MWPLPCLVFGHIIASALRARRLPLAFACPSHLSAHALLVLIWTCCCRGSIHDLRILLVGTVRSGYIKEIRRDQPHERDRLWLTSSETGGGPHWKNKGIAIYKTFRFHCSFFKFFHMTSLFYKTCAKPCTSIKTRHIGLEFRDSSAPLNPMKFTGAKPET